MKLHLIGKSVINIMMLVAVSLSTATAFGQDPQTDSTKTPQPVSQADAALQRTQLDAETVIKSESAKSEVISLGLADTRAEANPNRFQPTRFSSVPNTIDPAAANPKQSATSSDWQISFAPYIFLSGISGTVGAQGRTAEIDLSIGDVLKNFDIGLMGTLEVKKGKLIFVNDLVWTKLSSERETPGELFSTAKIGVNLFIIDPEVGYRLVESEKGALDVLGGVRIWSVENNLNFTTGILPGFDVSARKTWAAPVVGVRGNLNLSPKFFLVGKFDIGGAGIGADLTTQFFGGAGYRITQKIALIGGYRYLQVDYDDSEGFLFDTRMSGLMFGAKFTF